MTDASGSGNNGTLSGATRSTAGRYGGALSFDGTNDSVSVPDAASLDLTNNLTLSTWVRPTGATSWRTLVVKERPGGLSYGLYASGDIVGLFFHNYPSCTGQTRNVVFSRLAGRHAAAQGL